MYKLFLTVGLLGFFGRAFAQNTPQKTPLPLASFDVEVSYGFQLPAADLGKRFGYSNMINGGVHYKTPKLWFYGADGGYFFGSKVKEDVLKNIKTTDGELIGFDKEYAFFNLNERGVMVGATVGKIIPVFPNQHESGLRFALTVGYMQHKIRVKDDNGTVPAINETYRKGYDRLTAGAAITEFLGYHYINKSGFINCFAGVELTQGITKSQRSWDFDLMARDNRTRLDLLNTLRIGWTLDIKHRTKKQAEEIYY